MPKGFKGFQKGHPSWNKGIKTGLTSPSNFKVGNVAWNHPNNEKTRFKKGIVGQYQFKKGNKPWNWTKNSLPTPLSKKIRKSDKYCLWREKIFERDNYVCHWCGIKSGIDLEAHHFMEFAKYPKLRFVVNNGITLCIDCHNYIHSKSVVPQGGVEATEQPLTVGQPNA